ncbi:MAG: HAMP domain-containing histidine kinase [Flavobacteriaceae bacterium]
MNTKKYNWILYLITATIITTVAVQFYWNFKNYQENRQRVNNEIQISLDNAIEEYYSSISKRNFFGVFNTNDSIYNDSIPKNGWIKEYHTRVDTLTPSIAIEARYDEKFRNIPKLLDSLFKADSLQYESIKNDPNHIIAENRKNTRLKLVNGRGTFPEVNVIEGIKTVYIALTNDGIDFTELDSLFNSQLASKNISTDYYFDYIELNRVIGTTKELSKDTLDFFTNSKSTYLRPTQELRVFYSNPALAALKRSTSGILISLLLSLTVIGSLFYLLKIINRQKELAEIKNDLISNITHEFKTPIATVSTAIEAIENFNVLDDKEKTQKYLSMSSMQLKKLHQMVEKLLETATLDSEKLILNKEPIDLIDLVSKITTKHKILTDKQISFSSNVDSKFLNIDSFHFENAVSNLIDNAIKYGGENLEVTINSVLNTTEISVADDGKGIEKNQQEKIFDKFYRIPKGNKHDVKGFGIGLYYSKKIVKKHNGSIQLASTSLDTVFKISLPNG